MSANLVDAHFVMKKYFFTKKRIKSYLALGLALLMPSVAFSALPAMVRVSLFQAHAPVQELVVQGPFQLATSTPRTLGKGRYTLRMAQHQLLLCGPEPSRYCLRSQRFLLIPANGEKSVSLGLPNQPQRLYSGRLEFSMKSNHALRIINALPTRDYVALVVGSETPSGWPMEALKAQAVLTQTRLFRYQPGDALDDTTQQEVYLGERHRRPEVVQAVTSVWDEILTIQGHPVTPFYHASCAGHTSGAEIFGQHHRLPGMTGVPCAGCRLAPFGKPTLHRIPAKTYADVFPPGLPKVTQRDQAGRPLLVQFSNGSTQSGYAFWLAVGQRLGWDKAPGLYFSWRSTTDGQILFESRGAGHGVGLCQYGAAALARQHRSYQDILNTYFPGAKTAKINMP